MIPTLAGAFSSTPLFNEATGGTITTFTSDGLNYRRHTFLSNGTFTVLRSSLPFTIAVVGGGGGGGTSPDGFGAAAGGPGGFYSGDIALSVGSKNVIVGQGGANSGCVTIGGGPCFSGGQGGSSSITGGWTAGGGYGGGGFQLSGQGACPNTPVGVGSPSPAADGGVTARNNAAFGLSSSLGNGGSPSIPPYPGTCSTNGTSGAVVIQYRIV